MAHTQMLAVILKKYPYKMDKNKIPDIVLSYPTEFPEKLIEQEFSCIHTDKLDLRIFREDNGSFMAFEWLIPTAFGIYILKPYFDSFLSEAGKDHYNILKKGLKKIVEKGKFIKAKMVAATMSTHKLSKDYNQSLVVSLTIQTKNNKQIKLLFDNDLEKSDWDNAIDQILDFVIEHYESYPNDGLTKSIKEKSEKDYEIIYLIINPSSKELEFNIDTDLIKKYKQSKD